MLKPHQLHLINFFMRAITERFHLRSSAATQFHLVTLPNYGSFIDEGHRSGYMQRPTLDSSDSS